MQSKWSIPCSQESLLVNILSQINLVHPIQFPEDLFQHSPPIYTQIFPLGFPAEATHVPPMRATCPVLFSDFAAGEIS
jgi:hypothetical protein